MKNPMEQSDKIVIISATAGRSDRVFAGVHVLATIPNIILILGGKSG